VSTVRLSLVWEELAVNFCLLRPVLKVVGVKS